MSEAAAPAAAFNDPPPPTALVWAGFIAMMFGNFMALLDVQIVASSIGSIQAGISASRDEISWVQTGYLIAEVVGIPLSGFLARALGTRLLFTLAAFSFSIMSLLCSIAWDLNSLIVFRALQGFCGAPMIPLTMATMYLIFPRKDQMMAGALTGMVMTTASSLGPTIGGWVSGALGWRALFWLNFVPGILVAGMVWFALRQLHTPNFSLLKKIDLLGLVGLVLFLGSAEYALEEGPANEWFASAEVATWALISLTGAVIFFWRALTVETPVVDLRPFRNLSFSMGSVLFFVVGISLFSAIFLTPLFLASVRGYSSLQIGHTMFVQGATMFIAAPLVGRFGRNLHDTRWLAAVGLGCVSISCFLQAHLTAEAAFWEFAIPQVFRGAGFMISFTAIMLPAMQGLPPHLMHAGTGLFNTVRNLGGAFGIAALATVQAHSFALHRQELYAAADPQNPHVQAMIAGAQAHLEATGASDPSRQALMHYAGMLDREALVMTFNDQFLLLGIVIALSTVVVAFLRPPPRPASGAAPPIDVH